MSVLAPPSASVPSLAATFFLGGMSSVFFWLGFGRLEDLESCLRWWDGKRVLEKKTVQGGGFILDSGIWIREL